MAFHIPAGFIKRFLTARYAFAALAVATAVGLRLAFDPVLGDQAPYLPFVGAVLVAARLGGRGPALASTALSVLSALYFFLQPRFSFALARPGDLVGLGLFALAGVAISILEAPGLEAPGGIFASKAAADRPEGEHVDPVGAPLVRRIATAAGGAVALGILVTLVWTGLRSATHAEHWVEHTYQVLSASARVRSSLESAETSQRGYLLTGDEQYLQAYQSVVASERQARAALRRLTVDNHVQQARLNELDQRVRGRLDLLASTIEVGRRQGIAAAVSLMHAEGGKELIGGVWVILDAVDDEEHRLLESRTAAASAADSRTRWILGLGSGSLVLLLILAGVTIERYIHERNRVEKVLARQARLIDLSHDAIITTDGSRVITGWNSGAQQMYGWTEQEAVGQTIPELLLSNFATSIAEVDRILDREGRWYGELAHTRSDGRQIAVESRQVLQRDNAGRSAGYLEINRDITGRKEAEEAVRKERQLLQVTLNSIGDAVLATDGDGKITLLNPVAAALTDWTEEQALGHPARDVLRMVNEENREGPEDIIGRVMREGRAVAVANHTALIARDGREIPIEDSAAPIRDEVGNLLGVVLVFHDVTEKRRAQETLRESESRLHTLSDNLPDGAIYRYCHGIDGKPRFEFLSAGIERLTGIPAAEFMSDATTVEKSIVPEDRDRLRAGIALSREKLTQFEIVIRRKHRVTGEVRWSLLRSTPTRNPDGSTTWDGIELDITERQRAEEALRENRAQLTERTFELERTAAELEVRNREVERVSRMKTEFLARISHELRTPLNAIVGYSELLGEQSAGPLLPPYPRFVANIQEGALHLLAMVNDLLDISRIEAGRFDLNIEAFRPAEALEEVLSVITPLAKIKNIAIDNQVPPGMWIRADRTRFKQVLYNLFSNAVKFTPEDGCVWITEASREDAAGFCIGDTGIGIPESELEAIFDEFHQVGGPTGSSTKGTGLGLAITRRLVELHGGAIRAESTVGQGSRFTLTLGPQSASIPVL